MYSFVEKKKANDAPVHRPSKTAFVLECEPNSCVNIPTSLSLRQTMDLNRLKGNIGAGILMHAKKWPKIG